jgi:GTP pyrophosphokinase
VARIVSDLGLDDVTIAAALLHDTVEDTGVTLDDIARSFGGDVAAIVDGVTKLDRVQFNSKEAQQAATMRKMLVAMAKDLRVLIIKLADRLHNMRTIAVLPAWRQERISHETLDIYGPLAHRLGMQDVKTQLEDLAFAALHPKRYAEIDHMVSVRTPERDLYLTQVLEEVRQRLAELGISADVTGRPKHLYSIYEKMVVKGREFDDIFDLVGMRVVVESVKDCYAALGSIHATWKPVQGRFKDYVAMPKFNLYQSLHTTVIGPQGKPLEVQIRTWEMHARSEQGVAAHWAYKDRDPNDSDLPWLSRIVDWQSETTDPDEFMQRRPRAGRGLRLHAQGQGRDPAGRRYPDRLRLCHPHRGRSRLRRRSGERPAGAAGFEAVVRRHRRDLHVQGRGRRALARLAADRGHAPGGVEDPPVVLPRAARRRHRAGP